MCLSSPGAWWMAYQGADWSWVELSHALSNLLSFFDIILTMVFGNGVNQIINRWWCVLAWYSIYIYTYIYSKYIYIYLYEEVFVILYSYGCNTEVIRMTVVPWPFGYLYARLAAARTLQHLVTQAGAIFQERLLPKTRVGKQFLFFFVDTFWIQKKKEKRFMIVGEIHSFFVII